MENKYEMNVGLEVHVELSTENKLFCRCKNSFGDEPNTNICPVCTGEPGTLPVLNEEALIYAVRTGLALNCKIAKSVCFDRKHYFYPDLPKGFQITQYRKPVAFKGNFNGVRIKELHMEEDAGKLTWNENRQLTLIDMNRCGVPLLEIVTEPDIHSPEEAESFLEYLRLTLKYIGVSDCKMQEGSMRADVNVSVRPAGSDKLGPRAEIKNMSSLSNISKAISYEYARQAEILKNGGKPTEETRRWDEDLEQSFVMRDKESASEYMYMAEPDIPKFDILPEILSAAKAEMPKLPLDRKRDYVGELGLSEYEAGVLIADKAVSDLFDEVAQNTGNPKGASNIILGPFMRVMNAENISSAEMLKKVTSDDLSAIIKMRTAGRINANVASELVDLVYSGGIDPEEYVTQKGLELITDREAIQKAVAEAMISDPKALGDLMNGIDKAAGPIIGRAMKLLEGRADPEIVVDTLNKVLEHLKANEGK